MPFKSLENPYTRGFGISAWIFIILWWLCIDKGQYNVLKQVLPKFKFSEHWKIIDKSYVYKPSLCFGME